jgi:hypothetical protein
MKTRFACDGPEAIRALLNRPAIVSGIQEPGVGCSRISAHVTRVHRRFFELPGLLPQLWSNAKAWLFHHC